MSPYNLDLEDSLPTEKVWHPVRIDEVEEKPASPGKEFAQLLWTLTITEGEDVGMKIWDYTSLGASSAWRIRQYYEACGMDVPKRGEEWDPQDLVSKQFELKGEEETYEGRTRYKIREMRPLTVGTVAGPADSPKTDEDDIPF